MQQVYVDDQYRFHVPKVTRGLEEVMFMEEESVLMRDCSGKYNGSIVANH